MDVAPLRQRITELEEVARLASAEAAGGRLERGTADEYLRRTQNWDRRITGAGNRRRQAVSEAARLRSLIHQAKRYSPINGVVTSVRASAGDWVKGATPVVRIDDPRGYRIVSLVPDRTNAVPEVGAQLRVLAGDRELRTRVSRIMPGWDRELFSTWVWLVPARPSAFTPGQELEAVLYPET